jgi:hypothetical protein
VRSLNILLKFARLYGYDHARTADQLATVCSELREAIPPGSDATLLLGASGAQLLLDGVPLEGSPAEKQFAQLLSAAGLASVQFLSCITPEEVAKFAKAFPTGKAKPSELAQQLKIAMEGVQGIRVNEVCFVATDSRLKDATSVAAQLAAASIGDDKDQFKQLLNDPQKLLELIAAAEGTKRRLKEETEQETGEAPHGGPIETETPQSAGSGGSAYSGQRRAPISDPSKRVCKRHQQGLPIQQGRAVAAPAVAISESWAVVGWALEARQGVAAVRRSA